MRKDPAFFLDQKSLDSLVNLIDVLVEKSKYLKYICY